MNLLKHCLTAINIISLMGIKNWIAMNLENYDLMAPLIMHGFMGVLMAVHFLGKIQGH